MTKEECIKVCKASSMGNTVIERACSSKCTDNIKVEAPKPGTDTKIYTNEQKIVDLKWKAGQIQATRMGIGALGLATGLIVANRTGGGAAKYIGFGLLGAFVFGWSAKLATMKKLSETMAELEKLQTK